MLNIATVLIFNINNFFSIYLNYILILVMNLAVLCDYLNINVSFPNVNELLQINLFKSVKIFRTQFVNVFISINISAKI